MVIAARLSGRTWWQFITDSLPYAVSSIAVVTAVGAFSFVIEGQLALLVLQSLCGALLYIGINMVLGSVVQRDVASFLLSRFRR